MAVLERARLAGKPTLDIVSAAAIGSDTRRPRARDTAKILADCRDLAIHRLVLSFSSMLDRVGDMLMERSNRALVHDEAANYLAARRALNSNNLQFSTTSSP